MEVTYSISEGTDIHLEGPLLDSLTDWSCKKKTVRISEGSRDEWFAAIRAAVIYQDSIDGIEAMPLAPSTSCDPSPFAGQIIFTSSLPTAAAKSRGTFDLSPDVQRADFGVDDDIFAVVCLPTSLESIPFGLSSGLTGGSEPKLFHFDDSSVDEVRFLFVTTVNGVRFNTEYPDAFPGLLRAPLKNVRDGQGVEDARMNGKDDSEIAFVFRKLSEPHSLNRALLDELEEKVAEAAGGKATAEIQVEFVVAISLYQSYSAISEGNNAKWWFRCLAKGGFVAEFTAQDHYDRYACGTVKEVHYEEEDNDDPGSNNNSDDEAPARSNYSSSKSSSSSSSSTAKKTSSSSSSSSASKPKEKPKEKPAAKPPAKKEPPPKKPTKCNQCSGTGKKVCDQCTSGTRSKCSHCKGTGRFHKCTWCNGKGEVMK